MEKKTSLKGRPGRPKGLPKTGGRQKGVGNKIKSPVKTLLKDLSLDYIASGQLKRDLDDLDTAERVDAHIRLMKFHTSEERAQQVDVSVNARAAEAIDETLMRLLEENED